MPRGNGGGLPVGRRRRPGRPTSGAPGTAGPTLPAGTRRGIAPMQSSCGQTARQSTSPAASQTPAIPRGRLRAIGWAWAVIPGRGPPRRRGDVHRNGSGQPGLARRAPDMPAAGTGVSLQTVDSSTVARHAISADRCGRCAMQHDRMFRTELGFSHVRWVLTRASVVAEAAVSRRGCSGSVTTRRGPTGRV